MEEEISYKGLRRIQQLEKNAPGLSKIPTTFYSQVFQYIQGLQEAYQNEENTQKQTLIHDELQKIQRIIINIYEHREKKILKAALSTARGGSPDLSLLLQNEQELYHKIVETLDQQRSHILEQSGTTKKKEGSKQKSQPPQQSSHLHDHTLVRVTADIPDFMGTDMKTYHLKKDDVLCLPHEMAQTLSKRKAVHLIS